MTTIHISATLKESIIAHIQPFLDGKKCLIVSDCNTRDACGWNSNIPIDTVHHHSFSPPPKASEDNAHSIVALLRIYPADVIMAVGSGTINDLCKYAAYVYGIPYIGIPTAASMNGYCSTNASLLRDGIKQSLTASPPEMLCCALDIIRNAPARLFASGVGDTLCNSTIRFDTALAAQLPHTTTTHDAISAPINEAEQQLIAHLSHHTRGDAPSEALLVALIHCLFISGKAMSDAGSSAPASQGEHMIAHMLDMLDPTLSERYYHGEIIGVTSVHMSRLQSYFHDSITFSPRPFPETYITDWTTADTAKDWQITYEKKISPIADQEIMLHPPHVSHRLRPMELMQLLYRAECPVTPDALGISDDMLITACKLAPYSRDRFTLLDLS